MTQHAVLPLPRAQAISNGDTLSYKHEGPTVVVLGIAVADFSKPPERERWRFSYRIDDLYVWDRDDGQAFAQHVDDFWGTAAPLNHDRRCDRDLCHPSCRFRAAAQADRP